VPPRVSDDYLEARREQILEAAAVCFSRKGFHKTTMRDICRKSSMSPGALYRYFSGKEEIIKAMVEQTLERNTGILREAGEKSDTFNALEELADIFFGMMEDPKKHIIRLDIELWAEALRNRKIMRILRRSLANHRKELMDIIRRAQLGGSMREDVEPEAVARVMISFFDGLTLQKGIDPKTDIWSYVAVIKLMMAGLFENEKGRERCE